MDLSVVFEKLKRIYGYKLVLDLKNTKIIEVVLMVNLLLIFKCIACFNFFRDS